MKKDQKTCRVCDCPLESPFARNRGVHKACLDAEKSDGGGGGHIEK